MHSAPTLARISVLAGLAVLLGGCLMFGCKSNSSASPANAKKLDPNFTDTPGYTPAPSQPQASSNDTRRKDDSPRGDR